jgi:hypothetical protein
MHRVVRVMVVVMMMVVMRPAMNRRGERCSGEGRQQCSEKNGLDLHGDSPIRVVRIAPNLSSGPDNRRA